MKRAARTTRPARGRHAIASQEDKLIAERVKDWMRLRAIDAHTLAQRLDLKDEHLARILKGEISWSLSLLSRLADALQVTETDLDPAFDPALRHDLENLELRHDLPHLQALHTFIRSLPQIQEPEDLNALKRILEALATPAPKS